LNLFVVDPVDFPHGGAHSEHVTLLVKGLRSNGEKPFLIMPYGHKKEGLSEVKSNYGRFEGVPYCFISKKSNLPKGIGSLASFSGVLKTAIIIYQRFRKRKLDAVILGGIVDILRDSPIIIVCWVFKIPCFYWLVEKASLNEDYKGVAGNLNYRSQQLSEFLLPKLATGLIVISGSLKNYYKKYLPEEKILISPILVPEDIVKIDRGVLHSESMKGILNEIEGKKILVYSGSFGEKDGIFVLLEAFNIIVMSYPDTIFIMTGRSNSPEIMKRVASFISKNRLDKNVRLVGFVSSGELLYYNNIADILFVCRSNSSYANHGFPWKLGEYCLTRKPIIATSVSDIEFYFRDNVDLFIVKPDDPTAIADKITYILNNYNQALQIAQNGWETAIREFGYIKKTKEIVDFLHRNVEG